ncbi:Integral membrane protein GPR180 [Oryzias melastigma]|uniref:G protein-coupled receptor 180 n=1 Tax=Oryzias melastigma TaxID=30732 RepID=A0A3B3D5A6_ORYME|nr:integral membrane protein GPR180 isoform X1 [Oryzias melastigma]KAF6737242.1 Integral membrane protein GPR180 [Oryzias melastigma]
MSRLLAAFLAPLLFCLGISGKTVTGIFRSEAARRENGQFITAFVFRGDGGLLVCQLDDPALAAQKQSKLLLYQDLDLELDSLSCAEKLRKAQITVSLSQEEHNQSIPHQAPPTSWTLLYTDRHTCQENPEDPADPDLTFTVLLLNPDSAGNPLDHFSAEEAGIHTFFSLLLLSYFISCCIYLGPLQQALRKRGPMHTALKLLTAALAIQGCSALCRYIHLCRYSTDGSGFALMDHLADFWDMLSQGAVLFLLLSLCVGWTLTRARKAQSRPLQWEWSPASTAFSVGGVVAQGGLLLWEQFSESQLERHGDYAQQSWAGVLLVVLRVGLALLLASVLYQIISTERSTLKRDFYLSFSRACFLWFLCHPVLVFMSGIFNRHQRQKVVTVGVVLCRCISMVILYQLFLSRSLYWEVSSLSSVSLPFTMSRTNSRGR